MYSDAANVTSVSKSPAARTAAWSNSSASAISDSSGAYAAWIGGTAAFLVVALAVACALAKRKAIKRMLQGHEWRHAMLMRRQPQRDVLQQQSDAACYCAFQDDGNAALRTRSSSNSTLAQTEQLLDTWCCDLRLIVRVRPLGLRGTTSHTWLGTYRDDAVVIKTLATTASDVERHAFVYAMRTTARLTHPNVVRFCGVAWTKATGLQALYEFMDRGDLQTFIRFTRATPATTMTLHQHWPLAWWGTRLLEIALDVAQALLFLHTIERVRHSALTSRCVLLNHEFSAKLTGFAHVQALGDYGAIAAATMQTHRRLSVEALDAQEAIVSRIHSHNMRWCAPEVLVGDAGATGVGASEAVDIYAFGAVLVELDSLAMPFERVQRELHLSDAQLQQRLATGALQSTLPITIACPAPVRELLRACLAHDPSDRPSAATIVQTLREVAAAVHRESSLAGVGATARSVSSAPVAFDASSDSTVECAK